MHAARLFKTDTNYPRNVRGGFEHAHSDAVRSRSDGGSVQSGEPLAGTLIGPSSRNLPGSGEMGNAFFEHWRFRSKESRRLAVKLNEGGQAIFSGC